MHQNNVHGRYDVKKVVVYSSNVKVKFRVWTAFRVGNCQKSLLTLDTTLVFRANVEKR